MVFRLSDARSERDTVLLIGASGFVGARIAQLLGREACFNLVCLDRSPPRDMRRSTEAQSGGMSHEERT